MNLRTALLQGTKLLDEARVPAPRLTAEVLLSHAIQRERTYLFTHPEEELSELGWIHYGRYLHQRMEGRPTQYITKRQEFFGRDFYVSPDVLIPRPETEGVVEFALPLIPERARVLDVGTGSGAIAVTIALEKPVASVYAADISRPALRIAKRNARALEAPITFIEADLLAPFTGGSFDVIISNPPYVSESARDGLQREVADHEPPVALFGGPAGTEMYQQIIADAPRVLRPRGSLIFELGYDSLERVVAMFDHRWEEPLIEPDLARIPRALAARLRP